MQLLTVKVAAIEIKVSNNIHKKSYYEIVFGTELNHSHAYVVNRVRNLYFQQIQLKYIEKFDI